MGNTACRRHDRLRSLVQDAEGMAACTNFRRSLSGAVWILGIRPRDPCRPRSQRRLSPMCPDTTVTPVARMAPRRPAPAAARLPLRATLTIGPAPARIAATAKGNAALLGSRRARRHRTEASGPGRSGVALAARRQNAVGVQPASLGHPGWTERGPALANALNVRRTTVVNVSHLNDLLLRGSGALDELFPHVARLAASGTEFAIDFGLPALPNEPGLRCRRPEPRRRRSPESPRCFAPPFARSLHLAAAVGTRPTMLHRARCSDRHSALPPPQSPPAPRPLRSLPCSPP